MKLRYNTHGCELMNGNKLWCACEKCRNETRESLCCQEVAAISEEKLAGKSDFIILLYILP